MRTLKTAIDARYRAGDIRNFHPDILRLLEVLARIERRRQERLQITRAGKKH